MKQTTFNNVITPCAAVYLALTAIYATNARAGSIDELENAGLPTSVLESIKNVETSKTNASLKFYVRTFL
ncbi:hypothetical protein A3A20_00175 [Candidatus Wolfebacteria bacterium RIFCSPLOWO2_01_FULL_45_19]|uniref:Uncharacterized protein n=1 Tax=Candidatus Wolfebacteria bacterium RIFCSPLOWO2_01_FULL_45_19 TaxID=1802557 RepID=A0A1F8DRF1_9BACT|nr:MAG: hypothetical protein UX23_C0007G0026 [Parcubacteria group bacterium GW2011_GWB1_45_9]OGM90986.1 MAG: hypothetical protein A3A20_00175 [Candidatus Wolfebacteria bacterium RIFCSPLOWO2_01_FULL_45_19]